MSRNWLATHWIGVLVDFRNQLFLLFAWISGIVVWFNLQVGGWLVLLVLLTGLYLGIQSKSLFRDQVLKLPIAVFLLSALVGVWAAYDTQAAFHKFMILLAGVIIYAALARLRTEDIYWFFGLVSLTAQVLAGYFLLSNNWVTQPADFGLVNRIGKSWMTIRIGLPSIFDNANIPAGILAVMFPWVVAFTWFAQTNQRRLWRWLGWTSLTFISAAILMSSSRAVWGMLAVGFAAWVWWEICNRGAAWLNWNPRKLFLSGVLIVSVIGLYYLISITSRFHAIASLVPGESSAVIRASLYHQTTDLIPDFWLTGGGLQSFAGLYSQYILDIPYLYFRYAHNLWLDITIEQGIFGLLSFLLIYGTTIIKLLQGVIRSSLQPKSYQVALLSLLAATSIFVGHGFVDDSFYGVRGTSFLFVIPGLLASLQPKLSTIPSSIERAQSLWNRRGVKPAWGSFLILLIVGISFTSVPVLRSAVQANLGAVAMAKIELAGFPQNSWDDGLSGASFNEEKALFIKALENNPDQRTANHCLGRIAMQDGEYQEAVEYLSQANHKDPNHAGIRKSLGYAYVWLGDFEEAYPLINVFPEAASEMDSYRAWWKQNGNLTLSANANKMLNVLQTKK